MIAHGKVTRKAKVVNLAHIGPVFQVNGVGLKGLQVKQACIHARGGISGARDNSKLRVHLKQGLPVATLKVDAFLMNSINLLHQGLG